MIPEFERLQQSPEFVAWKKKHPQSYLAHCFILQTQKVQPIWQFGYYSAMTDTITTFSCKESIEVSEHEDIFKDPSHSIHQLDLRGAIISYAGALQTAQLQKEKILPSDVVSTTMAILQQHRELGLIWNVTLVTHSLKTCTIKIDAKSGSVVQCAVDSLLNLATVHKGEKGSQA
jgi:hypothetical protein